MAPAAPSQNAPRPPSDTKMAERSIQIVWEPGGPPPNLNSVLDRLLAPDQVRAVAEKVLGAKPAGGDNYAWKVPVLELRDHSCSLAIGASVAVAKGDKPVARELADALVERLAALLRDDRAIVASERLNRVKEEVREAESELEALRRRVREKAAQLGELADRADLSPSTLDGGVAKLEDERQRIELELAGMEARLEAVQEQFEKATVTAAKQADADPVIPELEKAVAARQKLADLTRKLADTGNADGREVPKAEAELVEAKVQLLDRKSAAASRGGDAVAPLTREMQNLAIDIRDRKARLAHVQKRLRPMRDAVRQFSELQWMEEELKAVQRMWEEANARHREAARAVESVPVDRVIVVNATEVPVKAEAPKD
jgi:chromosome segregation ATPase